MAGIAAMLLAVALLFVPLLSCDSTGCGRYAAAERVLNPDPPANAILFIGDGMGFEHVRAAGMYSSGSPGTLAFEGFPRTGSVSTHEICGGVTDSAASSTAMATGAKVRPGVISTALPGDGSELMTLVEYFNELGKSTGLVTTAFLTHATPAAFGAHEPRRDNYTGIASDYLAASRPRVLMGGARHITYQDAAAAGYAVVEDRAGLLALDTESAGSVAGLFGSDHMPFAYDGPGGLPSLSEMTSAALDILDNDPDGFFLMVEGGRIDHASHQGDIARAVLETVEFSGAVRSALEWAAGRTDTLIIVTADHETGGLAVLRNNGQGAMPDVTWSTHGHTLLRVPVYAWGERAELINGPMDNTDVFRVIITGRR